jgi:PAS domain S-box-containing protein
LDAATIKSFQLLLMFLLFRNCAVAQDGPIPQVLAPHQTNGSALSIALVDRNMQLRLGKTLHQVELYPNRLDTDRWGFVPRDLPAENVLIYQQPTIWQAYTRLMILGIFLLLAQALIIIAILWQRAKTKNMRAELIRSNDRLRLAIETLKAVEWECDLASGEVSLVGDLRTLFGIPSDTFVAQPKDFYRHVHPEDRQLVSQALEDARRSLRPFAQEFRVNLSDDGPTRWVTCSGKFEYASNGQPTRMFGLAVDVTDRKKTEEALKKSEEKFSKVFGKSPMALTLTSTVNHRYIDVNETFEKITGWKSQEVIGRTPFDIGIWDDPAKRTEFVERLLAEKSIRDLMVVFRTKDRQERFGLGAAELIDIDGEPCAISTISDITEIERANQERQFSGRGFRQFFETMPQYCYISGPDGAIVDVNQAACNALGYPKDELVGRPLSSIYASESRSKIMELLEKWTQTGTLRNEAMVVLTKNAQKKPVLLNAGSVLDTQGNLLFSISVQTDISDLEEVRDRLQENKVLLDSVVESAMDAIIVVDEAQRVVVFNLAAEKMFHCRAKEASGKPLDQFIPERFRAALRSQIREFAGKGIGTRMLGVLDTLSARRVNGEEFPIEASISKSDVGGNRFFTAIIRDVTERRRAEEVQSRHSAIVESSNDAIISANLEGILLSWNAAARRMYGYTKEEAIGRPITIIVPPLLRSEEAAIMQRIGRGERVENFETIRMSKSGTRINVSITASAIRDLNGKIVGVSKIARDITQTKKIEAALRENEERFRLVANTAPVMIWMSGPDKLCTYVNQPWLEFTGRALEAELGNGWTESVHPVDLTRCMETYKKVFDRREVFRMEYRLRRHDGEYRWIFDQGAPRFDDDGSFAGYVGCCIDVTDRKQAEEALSTVSQRLIEAHEEERTWLARELHDDINQRIALLVASLARVKQFFPSSAVEANSQIDDLCNQATSLGIDVQSLSHRLHSSKLDYLGLKSAAAGLCREVSDQHAVKIDFLSDEMPKNLSKEISLCLFRVLQESLQNAMKHSGSKHFQVTFVSGRDDIRLMVSDFGIGFDPGEALKGRGVGLTNMRERLKLVGGELSISSEPGAGTIVRARVPLFAQTRSMGSAM